MRALDRPALRCAAIRLDSDSIRIRIRLDSSDRIQSGETGTHRTTRRCIVHRHARARRPDTMRVDRRLRVGCAPWCGWSAWRCAAAGNAAQRGREGGESEERRVGTSPRVQADTDTDTDTDTHTRRRCRARSNCADRCRYRCRPPVHQSSSAPNRSNETRISPATEPDQEPDQRREDDEHASRTVTPNRLPLGLPILRALSATQQTNTPPPPSLACPGVWMRSCDHRSSLQLVLAHSKHRENNPLH